MSKRGEIASDFKSIIDTQLVREQTVKMTLDELLSRLNLGHETEKAEGDTEMLWDYVDLERVGDFGTVQITFSCVKEGFQALFAQVRIDNEGKIFVINDSRKGMIVIPDVAIPYNTCSSQGRLEFDCFGGISSTPGILDRNLSLIHYTRNTTATTSLNSKVFTIDEEKPLDSGDFTPSMTSAKLLESLATTTIEITDDSTRIISYHG